MANKRRNRQKTPWTVEVRIIISALIIFVPTPLLIYLWMLYGDFTLFGVQPTDSELFVGSLLRPLILIAPFASITLAFMLHRRIRKKNRTIISQLSEAEKQTIHQQASRRYVLYTVIAGIALGLAAMNHVWPSVKDYYLTTKYEAEVQNALDRGCVSFYDISRQQDKDKEFEGHQTIVRQWDPGYYSETVTPLRAAVAQSFEKCRKELLTPAEQQGLTDEYRLILEKRAHELLEENPYNLSTEKMNEITQLEQKNHQ